MSADPDPAELPRDPADYARPRLMGVGFWAMIALAVVYIPRTARVLRALAGEACARRGPPRPRRPGARAEEPRRPARRDGAATGRART